MPQIAIRLSEDDLEALDASVARGTYPSRAAAVRAGLDRLLRDERDRAIADAYRRGYGLQPEDENVGEAGLALMAEAVRGEERRADQDER